MQTFAIGQPMAGLMQAFAAQITATGRRGVYWDESIGFDLKHMRPGMWRIPGYRDVRMLLDGAPELKGAVSTRKYDDLWAVNDATLGATRFLCPTAIEILHGLHVVQVTAGSDPPLHNFTRDLMGGGRFPMTAKQVEAYQGFIREQAMLFARALRGRGTVDLVTEFASPLTMSVISRIFNVPPHKQPEVLGWAHGQMNFLWGSKRRGPHTKEECNAECAWEIACAQGLVDFWGYCLDLAGTPQPAGSFMAHAQEYRNGEGKGFSHEELASLPFNFLVAGQESTTSLICMVVAIIMSVPGLAEQVRRDPVLLRKCIWEVLRILAPFYRWIRRARVQMELGGKTIQPGELLLLEVAAANSDVSVFSDPFAFDPFRNNRGIITSFGFGDHSCPGANISLAEAEAAVLALLEQDLQIAPGFKPAFQPNDIHLMLTTLPVLVAA